MKEHKLCPLPSDRLEEFYGEDDVKPYQKALESLERATRFWPIVISETILGNLANVSESFQIFQTSTVN